METIDINKCTSIGKLLKTHGLNGELILMFEPQFDSTLENSKFLFFEIEGGLVPFFFSDNGLRFRTHETAIVKFDEIDTQEKAKQFVDCQLYVYSRDITVEDENKSFSLINYNVVDENHGSLGSVINVDNFSGNNVITVIFNSNEVMIPLSDEILTKIDYKNKEIFLTCPEGLLDLYI